MSEFDFETQSASADGSRRCSPATATSSKVTLAHGDANHWNMLAPRAGGDVVILDWQTWHVDVGAYDLACLMGMGWFEEQRNRYETRLLDRYLLELNRLGIRFDREELLYDYRFALVRHLFTPVIFSTFILPAVWWSHLERVFSSFESWDCRQILD